MLRINQKCILWKRNFRIENFCGWPTFRAFNFSQCHWKKASNPSLTCFMSLQSDIRISEHKLSTFLFWDLPKKIFQMQREMTKFMLCSLACISSCFIAKFAVWEFQECLPETSDIGVLQYLKIFQNFWTYSVRNFKIYKNVFIKFRELWYW